MAVRGEPRMMPETPRLQHVAQHYVERLPPAQRAQLNEVARRAQAEGRPLRVGTACSGTDSPVVVFEALSKAFPALAFEHSFSCEYCPKKRLWIYQNFPKDRVPVMFKDVRDLSQDAAVDDRTQRLCAVPAVDIFIAGFVCKSVSMQNARRGEAKDCIREASGLTGVTFQGIVEYVKAKRPPVVILENVRGLTVGNLERPPVIRDVEKVFHQNDYAFAWRILNTWDFLLPQRRNRCWMWAFRGRGNQSAAERAGDIISGLGQEQKFWKMADLFHQVQARPAQPSKKKLTVRERDVVKEVRKQVPRNLRSGLVVDVGQSVGRGHFCVNGVSPCLLPNSKIQFAFKAGKSIKRRILGIEELMALQGLFREDFPALPAWATERRVLSRDLLGNAFTTTVLMAVSVGVCAEGPLRGSATRAGA